jgi:hypothetical protein
MVLAQRGTAVTEEELVQQTELQAEVTAFEDVLRLARHYRLSAALRRFDLDEVT